MSKSKKNIIQALLADLKKRTKDEIYRDKHNF